MMTRALDAAIAAVHGAAGEIALPAGVSGEETSFSLGPPSELARLKFLECRETAPRPLELWNYAGEDPSVTFVRDD